ncbi:MAG: glycine cleavage system protein H [Proteobacteria bacterium]|nr:glycine cleavage system protein H [Pseudomonadota bacterium]
MVAILFVISFAVLIAVSYYVEKKKETVMTTFVEMGPRDFIRTLALPKGIFLASGHTWAEVLSNGHARVGVDDFVRKLVGKIDRVQILPVRSKVKRAEPMCTLHQAGRDLTVRAPLSGTIVNVNPRAADSPSSLNADSYVAGWLAVIEPSDLASEIKFMRVADEASAWLRQELRRFRDFIEEHIRPSGMEGEYATAGNTLLDGGAPVAGLLGKVGPDTWRGFEREFLCSTNNTFFD